MSTYLSVVDDLTAAELFDVRVTDDGLVQVTLDPVTAGHLAEAWWWTHTRGMIQGRDIHVALEQTTALACHAGQAAHDSGVLHVGSLTNIHAPAVTTDA